MEERNEKKERGREDTSKSSVYFLYVILLNIFFTISLLERTPKATNTVMSTETTRNLTHFNGTYLLLLTSVSNCR